MFRDIEQKERYRHPFNTPVFSKFGAPMGRMNIRGCENIGFRYCFYESVNFHCVRVPLNEGYDKGGAYWGIGQNLYCIHAFEHIEGTTVNYNAQFFVRADNREQAKKGAREYFGDMITFYR